MYFCNVNTTIRDIELLAPARNAQVAFDAIDHGADAVYMGAPRFGARALAGNSVDDIARVCDYAHKFRARVYATVNTILYDDELQQAERLIKQLYDAQVDAIIVQDLALLRLDLPPIALHSSTQCDLRSPDKARFLQNLGFSQLVLARELSLNEIQDIHDAVSMPLEAFVHGALCVSYSGRCAMSQVIKGRSANRGQCAQMCRLPYDLLDEQGNVILNNKHLLSLRDLNLSDNVGQMMDAGVSSFKIEGRLKDAKYVKNVVAHYRRLLDDAINASNGRYRRLSCGNSDYSFEPDVTRSFNRSFTHYFINGRNQTMHMACLDTPKSMGQPIGKVVASHGRQLTVDTTAPVVNGDGLSFFDDSGEFNGVRVNVAAGRRLSLREPVNIKPGTLLYRTADKAFDDVLSRHSAQRTIAVDARLYEAGGAVVLRLDDERGNSVTHTMTVNALDVARTPQYDRQRDVMAKLGDTIYRINSFTTALDDKFVPLSLLAQLRRDTIALLDRANALTHRRILRRPENLNAQAPSSSLSHADNVANQLALQVYMDHGVVNVQPAVETPHLDNTTPLQESPVLLHSRYCLRRELDACLKGRNAHRLPAQLFLRTGSTILAVHCDCSRCEMKLSLAPSGKPPRR